MITKLQSIQAQLDSVILHVDDVLDALAKEETSHRWLASKMRTTTELLLAIKADLVAARTLIISGGE